MTKLYKIITLLIVVLLMSNCKKEEDNWTACIDCEFDSWVGTYEGNGVYYRDSDSSSVIDVPTIITVEAYSEKDLKVVIDGDDLYSLSKILYKPNNDYFIEVAGSSSSISLTLYKKDNSYKLSGTAKNYHYNSDTVLVIDQSFSYETFKVNDLSSY